MAKTATRTARKSIYSVHPGVLMTQKWMAELKQKTGRTLAEWLKLIKKEGPPTEQERREWLKTKYGLGTNTAWWFAERSVGKGEEMGDEEDYQQGGKGLSVPDNRSAVSQSRLRANQTHDTDAHRLWPGAWQSESAKAADRHGRLCKERSNHTSFRNNFTQRY